MPQKQPKKVDLNTADREELKQVKGFSDALADAIIRHRRQRGSFHSVEDLKDVPGISRQMLEGLRDQVTVSSPEEELA